MWLELKNAELQPSSKFETIGLDSGIYIFTCDVNKDYLGFPNNLYKARQKTTTKK